jgi:hypothetical protein
MRNSKKQHQSRASRYRGRRRITAQCANVVSDQFQKSRSSSRGCVEGRQIAESAANTLRIAFDAALPNPGGRKKCDNTFRHATLKKRGGLRAPAPRRQQRLLVRKQLREQPVQRAECAVTCIYDCPRHQSRKHSPRSSQSAALRSRSNELRRTHEHIVGCTSQMERDYYIKKDSLCDYANRVGTAQKIVRQKRVDNSGQPLISGRFAALNERQT